MTEVETVLSIIAKELADTAKSNMPELQTGQSLMNGSKMVNVSVRVKTAVILHTSATTLSREDALRLRK